MESKNPFPAEISWEPDGKMIFDVTPDDDGEVRNVRITLNEYGRVVRIFKRLSSDGQRCETVSQLLYRDGEWISVEVVSSLIASVYNYGVTIDDACTAFEIFNHYYFSSEKYAKRLRNWDLWREADEARLDMADSRHDGMCRFLSFEHEVERASDSDMGQYACLIRLPAAIVDDFDGDKWVIWETDSRNGAFESFATEDLARQRWAEVSAYIDGPLDDDDDEG